MSPDVARQRLLAQQIVRHSPGTPGEVVRRLGAVQAQDYLGALWAVGLRAKGATERDVEQALADRTIVRTWPLRGTLHFVAAEDARWMLELSSPRMIARGARRFAELELDEAVFDRCRTLFARALRDGKALSRSAMVQLLEKAKISTRGQRGIHILWRMAQEGLLCFGARQGKEQTFVLLEEWVPRARRLQRDEALAEIALRYFTAHGPATLQDFAWWSGLAAADARAALESVKPQLVQEVAGGQTYWLAHSRSSMSKTPKAAERVQLLPPFDEYLVGYQDRSAVLEPHRKLQAANGLLSATIILDGRVAGTWRRTLKKNAVAIALRPFEDIGKTQRSALVRQAEHYGRFLGATAQLL